MSEDPNKKEQPNPSSDDDWLLFSDEEMLNLVKAFYIALVNDTIHLNFLGDRKTIKTDDLGNPLFYAKDVDSEYDQKKQLVEAIEKVIGTTPASSQERRQLIRSIVSTLFAYKMNNGWLVGSFYDFTFEKRLDGLEKTMGEISTLVKRHEERIIRDGL